MRTAIETSAIDRIVPADEGPLLSTPLASIDGVVDASGDASGVGDAFADLDALGRADLLAVGVGVGVAERVGREAITTTVPPQPWIVQ